MSDFAITFILNGKEYTIDLVEIAKIKGININEEIQEFPEKFAEYVQLVELAQAEYEKAKEELIREEAALFVDYKSSGMVNGTKATEKLIDNTIVIDDGRMESKREEMAKKELYRRLLAGKEALNHKKDLLSTLSANLRKETDF